MKTQITQAEYLQLVGLLTLAHHHKRIIDEVQKSMEEITGEENEIGSHSGDYIWEEMGKVDELLKDLKIKVMKNGTKKHIR